MTYIGVGYYYSLPQTGKYTGLCYEPKMADLMNEIAVKLPDKWQDIGRGLGLEEYELKQIQAEHSLQQSTNGFFSSVFEKWHSGEPLVAVATCYTPRCNLKDPRNIITPQDAT